jgi:hypothetical protein
VRRVGVGPRPVPIWRASTRALADGFDRLLHDGALRDRATAMGERLTRVDGVSSAVAALERARFVRATSVDSR